MGYVSEHTSAWAYTFSAACQLHLQSCCMTPVSGVQDIWALICFGDSSKHL